MSVCACTLEGTQMLLVKIMLCNLMVRLRPKVKVKVYHELERTGIADYKSLKLASIYFVVDVITNFQQITS